MARFHGLLAVVACDPHHRAQDRTEGPWQVLLARLDSNPTTPDEDGLRYAEACILNSTRALAAVRKVAGGEPVLWRFWYGPQPKGGLPERWVVLGRAEVEAQQSPTERPLIASWLAMRAARERCRASGTWPPPPTSDWPAEVTQQQLDLTGGDRGLPQAD